MARKPQPPRSRRYPYAQLAAVRRRAATAAVQTFVRQARDESETPGLLLQAVITLGDKTAEGHLVQAVALPWFEIIELMQREPSVIYELDWRKWEEIIAGAYTKAGFDVTLTPRSGDGGCDVIATTKGVGSIRFVDQVKAYRPGHLVTANDVRALIGVLTLKPNVSKGILTTTSDFAPGLKSDPEIARLMPYRLELKGRDRLLDWLTSLASEPR